MTNEPASAGQLLSKPDEGLEPLASLPPDRHSLRALAMFNVIPNGHPTDWTQRYVYFVRAASGAIKIGSSCNPKLRLRGLRSGLPEAIELLAFLPGSYDREWYLHGIYSDERIRGEWFRASPRLLAFIARLTAKDLAA